MLEKYFTVAQTVEVLLVCGTESSVGVRVERQRTYTVQKIWKVQCGSYRDFFTVLVTMESNDINFIEKIEGTNDLIMKVIGINRCREAGSMDTSTVVRMKKIVIQKFFSDVDRTDGEELSDVKDLFIIWVMEQAEKRRHETVFKDDNENEANVAIDETTVPPESLFMNEKETNTNRDIEEDTKIAATQHGTPVGEKTAMLKEKILHNHCNNMMKKNDAVSIESKGKEISLDCDGLVGADEGKDSITNKPQLKASDNATAKRKTENYDSESDGRQKRSLTTETLLDGKETCKVIGQVRSNSLLLQDEDAAVESEDKLESTQRRLELELDCVGNDVGHVAREMKKIDPTDAGSTNDSDEDDHAAFLKFQEAQMRKHQCRDGGRKATFSANASENIEKKESFIIIDDSSDDDVN